MAENDMITQEQAESIAYAIIEQAVIDYRNAIRDKNEYMQRDCEIFFKSKFGDFLGQKYDPIVIMETVRKQTEEFLRLANEHLALKEEQENAFRCPICGGKVNISWKRHSKIKGSFNWKALCDDCGFFSWLAE